MLCTEIITDYSKDHTVTWNHTDRIMETEETAVARQRLDKHMSVAMGMHTTEELCSAIVDNVIMRWLWFL
jgi:hypothetical protein